MGWLFRTGLPAAAMVLSGMAMAQTAGSFDGVYAGVSASLSGPAQCVPAQTPASLTLANGNVVSATGFFSGTVDSRGHVVLHTKQDTRFEGQIDGAGTIKASGATAHCTYTMIWKKR